MKKRCFFFLFLGFLSWKNSNAQAYIYHPFPDSGALWINAYVDEPGCPPNPCEYDFYQLEKDTIINNLKYRPIYHGTVYYYPQGYTPLHFTGLLIRDDTINKEVFIHSIGTNNPDQLYYDFNLNVGDTLPNGAYSFKINGIYVTGIDSVLIGDGTYRKRFELNDTLTGAFAQNLYIIEGIGFTGGFLAEIAPGDGFEGGGLLACNSYEDTTFYNYQPIGLQSCDVPTGINQVKKPTIQIQPNPVASGGNIIIKGISENYSLTINNVLGQTVFSTPINDSQSITLPGSIKPGVYICRILTEDNLLMIKKIVVL